MIMILQDTKVKKTPCLSQFIPPPVEVGISCSRRVKKEVTGTVVRTEFSCVYLCSECSVFLQKILCLKLTSPFMI